MDAVLRRRLWQNHGHASFWHASHRALLEGAKPEVIQYFIYALEKEKTDPLAFLKQPVDAERRDRLFAGTRNLWCTAVLGMLSGRQAVRNGNRCVCMPPQVNPPAVATRRKPLFVFADVEVTVDAKGMVSHGKVPIRIG